MSTDIKDVKFSVNIATKKRESKIFFFKSFYSNKSYSNGDKVITCYETE